MIEPSDAIDWERFGATILAPSEPRLAEAVAAGRELERRVRHATTRRKGSTTSDRERADAMVSDGALEEMWEVMVQRADAFAFAEAPHRLYVPYLQVDPVVYGDQNEPRPRWKPVGSSQTPRNLATMVSLLAGDPAEIKSAEDLGLEACARLAPWGVPVPRFVAWTVLGPWVSDQWSSVFSWPIHAVSHSASPYPTVLDAGWARAHEEMERGRGVADRKVRSVRSVRQLVFRASIAAWAGRKWRQAASEGRSISDGGTGFFFPTRMNGVRFDSLPDALDPYAVAWSTGYVPLDVRGDVLLMGAPARGTSADGLVALREASIRRWGSAL